MIIGLHIPTTNTNFFSNLRTYTFFPLFQLK